MIKPVIEAASLSCFSHHKVKPVFFVKFARLPAFSFAVSLNVLPPITFLYFVTQLRA